MSKSYFSALVVLITSAAIATSTPASADRTILLPSAYTLATGFDLDVLQAGQYKPRTLSYLDIGTEYTQLEASYVSRSGVNRLTLSDESQVLPETFSTPAVSVGVLDLTNSAGAFKGDGFYGRGYFLVVTKGLDNSLNPPKIHGITFTGGLGLGSIHGPFGGITVGLPFKLLGTAEYDSRQMNYRVSLPIAKAASLSYDRLGRGTFIALDIHSPISM